VSVLHRKFISRRFGNGIGTIVKRLVFDRIDRTPAITVNPESCVEIHMLLRYSDVCMGLVALKSFLRFYTDVAVVIHDDGSLAREALNRLTTQVRGCHVVTREQGDQALIPYLKRWSNCVRFRSVRVNSLQLFDYNVLARRQKLISLDSDVIFIKEPAAVIEWCQKDSDSVIYNQEQQGTQAGKMLRRRHLPCIGNLNSGFLGYFRDIVDYDHVEFLLNELRGEPKAHYVQGYIDSCLKLSRYKPCPLDPEEYMVYMGQSSALTVNATMIHFITYLRFVQLSYPMLAVRVMRELKVAGEETLM